MSGCVFYFLAGSISLSETDGNEGRHCVLHEEYVCFGGRFFTGEYLCLEFTPFWQVCHSTAWLTVQHSVQLHHQSAFTGISDCRS